jgi:intraflagellar transport protein 57
MWENSLERLKILNYEDGYVRKSNKKAFNRVHFCHPAPNQGHQLEDFISISAWLIGVINGDPNSFKFDTFEDPNTKINKIIMALRKLEFNAAVTAQKLRTPHGEPICTVLDFLTEKALAAKGFQWGLPQYPAADEVIVKLCLAMTICPYIVLLIDRTSPRR